MGENNLERIKKKILQINTTNNDFLTGLEDVNKFYIEVQKKRLVDLFEMYEEELDNITNAKTEETEKETVQEKPKPEKIVAKKPEPVVEEKHVPVSKELPIKIKAPEAVAVPQTINIEKPIVQEVVRPKVEPAKNPEPKKRRITLADKLLNEDRNDLNKKYRNSKIESLAKAIHISKKFEFINNLFKNNAEMYKEVVSAIDQMENSEEAFEFLETVTVDQFDWTHQEKLAADFYHFVYRKFV